MEYFLCSKEVINAFPEAEHSKPFSSGYDYEKDEKFYVALLDFDNISDDFWCRECVPCQMDVSKITLKGAKQKGLFVEIEEKINLTNDINRAMTIYNLAEKYNCNPIEFINKIV
jgi:thiol-disulfide isomerase/thioredoxin